MSALPATASAALADHEAAMAVLEGALGTGLLACPRVLAAIADARAAALELEAAADRAHGLFGDETARDEETA